MLRQQHKIRKGLDTQTVKKKSVLSPFKKCLWGIPKNLIRIFILVAVLSFLYIIYILLNPQYELDFMKDSEHDFDAISGIHPFFRYLQDNYDPSQRFKEGYAK